MPEMAHYDITQEREFYKFFQPNEVGLASLPTKQNTTEHNGQQQKQQSPHRVCASPDRALTVFAQLATFRLNCRRSFISFFDRENQYILAEATKSLSLETQFASQPGDDLKFGATVLPRRDSVFERTVSIKTDVDTHGNDVAAFIVPDCQEDERFRRQSYIKDGTFRFYAGVAIVSPDGYQIGSYCVVDDKPREGLSSDEIAFMKDMATTVMVHIDMARAKSENIKGEKMVRGLGSFVEGKDTVEDWWMGNESPLPHNTAAHARDPSSTSSYDWANKQYSMHHDAAFRDEESPRDPFSPQGVHAVFNATDKDRESTPSRPPSREGAKPIDHDQNPHHNKTSKQDTLSIEVKATFGRASKIIREAMNVDGVCCFDAKAGHTFGGLIDQEPNERPKRRESVGNVDDASEYSESASQSGSDTNGSADEEEDKPCEVLGFSTVAHSSINGEQSDKLTDGMTETFLRSLLRRFPHGKILNFDENGSCPSERGGPPCKPPDWPATSKPKAKKSRKLRSGEASFIRQIFPQVRSLAIVPLWDSKQQFFAAAIAWTTSAYRVLTPPSELSYLAAFGDSIMAEVSRVDAKIGDKAKSDFISSISHELRSPLHGILGSVECLQDSELDPFQENLVHTVETCGKTLLDTIDHLLDFAKINNFTRKSTDPGAKDKKRNISLDSDVDLSIVTEEVLETVFAGHGFMRASSHAHGDDGGPIASSATSFGLRAQKPRKKSIGFSSFGMNHSNNLVSIVVDINKAEDSHWIFRTQAGAWRRILMNLFGNSLKYTKSGFVQVKLDAEPLPAEGKSQNSTVRLTIVDSGKGIAQNYLDKSLFVPFAQEDCHQPGTGLGLAITAAIIRSMGGTIDVKSEQGHGTEITVSLSLVHAPYSQESDEQFLISDAAHRTRGLKVGFVGFEADSFKEKPDQEVRSPNNARHTFMSSFHRLCQNWFDMDMVIMRDLDQADVDIFLTTEQGFNDIQDQLKKRVKTQAQIDAQSVIAATPLLVLCDSATTANMMFQKSQGRELSVVTEYISQPCGPRKLAKSLALCLSRLEDSKDPNKLVQTAPGNANKNDEKPNEKQGHKADVPHKSATKKDTPGANDVYNDRVGNSQDTDAQNKETKTPKPVASTSATRPQRPGMSRKDTSLQTPPKHLRHVLLVDDNTVNLQLLVMHVKKTGHTYATATNGIEALEAYKDAHNQRQPSTKSKGHGSKQEKAHSPFDFVLMDVSMPAMDGLESTRHIRAFERDNSIAPTTVIALTGLASTAAQQEAYSSGVNTFMTKPVKLKELNKIFQDDKEEEEEDEEEEGEEHKEE